MKKQLLSIIASKEVYRNKEWCLSGEQLFTIWIDVNFYLQNEADVKSSLARIIQKHSNQTTRYKVLFVGFLNRTSICLDENELYPALSTH